MNMFLQTLTPFLENTDIESIGFIQGKTMTASTDPVRIQSAFQGLAQMGMQEVLNRHNLFVLPINKTKNYYLAFFVKTDGNNFSNTFGKSLISGSLIDWKGVDELLFRNTLSIIPSVIADVEAKRILYNVRFALTEPLLAH